MATSKGQLARWILSTFRFVWTQWRRIVGVPVIPKRNLGINRPRPEGKVFWFHVPSFGSASVAMPFIQKCVLFDNVHVLLTSPHESIIDALRADELHPRVTAFHLPFDSARRFAEFVHHWKPQIAFFLEECNLQLTGVRCLHESGCRLVLFHARFLNDRFFDLYNCTASRLLFLSRVSYFSIIFPETQLDVGRLCLLGATPQQIPGWSEDLMYATEIGEMAWTLRNVDPTLKKSLKKRLGNRIVWLTFVAYEREMSKVAAIHTSLKRSIPDLVLFLIPETQMRCETAISHLHQSGLSAQMWTPATENYIGIDAFVVDPCHQDHVRLISLEAELVFVGSSSMSGIRGRNLVHACMANCAIVTGKQPDEFDQLIEEINHSSIIAAEEAEAVVYHSGRLRICGEDGDAHEDEERTSRPQNGMLHHLSPRTSSSSFSFVADILMSSFPYPGPTERPQTAPPGTSHPLRPGLSAEQAGRVLWRQASYPAVPDRPRTAEFETTTTASFHSVIDENSHQTEFRNLSRASNPEEPFIRFDSGHRGLLEEIDICIQHQPCLGDFTVFQIDEELYDSEDSGFYEADVSEILANSGEDENPAGLILAPSYENFPVGEHSWIEPHPSPISQTETQEADLIAPRHETPSESRSCSPINTGRFHSSLWNQEVRVLSPSGDYVTPATHLPFGITGPAIWSVQIQDELEVVLHKLLVDRLERRSRAHAALQGAARFAIGVVLEAWKVVYDHVVEEVIGQQD